MLYSHTGKAINESNPTDQVFPQAARSLLAPPVKIAMSGAVPVAVLPTKLGPLSDCPAGVAGVELTAGVSGGDGGDGGGGVEAGGCGGGEAGALEAGLGTGRAEAAAL